VRTEEEEITCQSAQVAEVEVCRCTHHYTCYKLGIWRRSGFVSSQGLFWFSIGVS